MRCVALRCIRFRIVLLEEGDGRALPQCLRRGRHELARLSWPATSNMWRGAFWQALLANMAAMYAVYHGPEGLRTIANRVHGLAGVFSAGVSKLGLETGSAPFFDTVKVIVGEGQAEKVTKDAAAHGVNLRVYDSKSVSTKSYTSSSCLFAWSSCGLS